jgi:hypothetical protein
VPSPGQVAAAIPHYIVLLVLDIEALVVVVGLVCSMFTGRCPRGMFDFVERGPLVQPVIAYVPVLVTDRYSPFRLTQ